MAGYSIVLGFAAAIFVYPLVAFVAGLVLMRSRIYREKVGDIIILAAHPDDCVICAGEAAIEAVGAQRSVHILYLTRGASRDDHAREEVRRKETVGVWEAAGVASDCLAFLGLPQASRVGGASEITAPERAYAIETVSSALRGAPAGAGVYFPAEGESHTDHRTLRAIAYESLLRVGRTDLRVFECPEYNPSFSLFCAPVRSVSYILRSIPFISKIAPSSARYNRADMTSGGPAYRLPPDASRVRKKQHMLRGFRSENGEKLAKNFGFEDKFSPIHDRRWAKFESHPLSLSLSGSRLSVSVVLFWISFWLFIWGMGAIATGFLVGEHGISKYLFLFVGLALLAYSFLGSHGIEKRITLWAAGLSVIPALFI